MNLWMNHFGQVTEQSLLGVAPITDKLREGILLWFGHVWRRQMVAPLSRVESVTVKGVGRNPTFSDPTC